MMPTSKTLIHLEYVLKHIFKFTLNFTLNSVFISSENVAA